MISYTCEKYYNGFASVRSYIMKEANKKHDFVEITLDGDLVPYSMRGQKMRVNSKTTYRTDALPQIARYDSKGIKKGEKYYLMDFLWKPIEEKPTDYTETGLKGLLNAWKKLKAPKQLPL